MLAWICMSKVSWNYQQRLLEANDEGKHVDDSVEDTKYDAKQSGEGDEVVDEIRAHEDTQPYTASA